MPIVILAACIFVLCLIYLILVGFAVHLATVKRNETRDWNFDPASDTEDTFLPSGNTPFRTCARDGNIWWNSMPLERLELKSRDGLALVGHLLRSPVPTRRIAFVIHGHRCVSGEMGFISKMYYDQGYHVFAPDQRAHGKSEGLYIGMGYYERYDMLLWLNAVVALMGEDCQIVLHGISMGASTIMMLVGEDSIPKNVICAIEDCGYTDAHRSIYHHLKQDLQWLPCKHAVTAAAGVLNKLRAGYAFHRAECIRPLRNTQVPMLFIHGTHDPVVPFSMLKDLYDAHPGEKDIFTVAGAPHGICYFWNPTEYTKKVLRFSDRFFVSRA